MAQVTKLAKTPKQAACCSSKLDQVLNPKLFKALGDPTRLKLLSCLARCSRACTTTEVAECCSVDFSVVTRHLALMAEAGIVESKKIGRTVHYQVRYRDLTGALRTLAGAIEECSKLLKPKGDECICRF